MLFCHAPGNQVAGLGDGPSDPTPQFYDAYGRRLLPITVDIGDQPQTWFYVEGTDPSTAQPMQQVFDQVTTLPPPPPPLVQAAIANPPPPAAYGSGQGQTVTVQTLYTPAQLPAAQAAQAAQTMTGQPPGTFTTAPVGQPIPSTVPTPAPAPSVSAPAPAPVSTVTSPSPAPVAPVVIPGGSNVPRAVIAVPPTGAEVAPDATAPGQTGAAAPASGTGAGLAIVLALLAAAAAGS